MTRTFLFRLSLMVSLTFALCGCSKKPNPESLLIHNVTIIDAKNEQRDAMSVRIQKNKIVEVLPSEGLKIPEGARVIDASGKYLIPGLWDAHVHLTYDQDLTPSMFDLFLMHGITSIRDTGGELELVLPLKKAAEKDTKNTPRVMITGPLLDGIPTVYNGAGPRTPKLAVTVGTVEEAIRQVARLSEAGVDVLKVYEMLSPEVFDAILKKADSLGIPVTGHVPLSVDAIAAAQVGMRSMEHLRNLEFAFTSDWDSLLTARKKMLLEGTGSPGGRLRANIHNAQRSYAFQMEDSVRKAQVLEQLAKNKVWQVPTLTRYDLCRLTSFWSSRMESFF